MVCVGIDVAKDKHDCCILDSEGTTLSIALPFPTTWMVSKVCYKQSKTVLKNQTK